MRNIAARSLGLLPLLATPALAGDFWSGWYAGFNLGANYATTCNTFTSQGQNGAAADFIADGQAINAGASGCASGIGYAGGVQVGANHRNGSVVTGFEADLDRLGGSNSFTGSGVTPLPDTFTITEQSSLDWLATFRARAGVLVDDSALLYVTGGVAMAHATGSETATYGSGTSAAGSGSGIVGGVVVGAGIEAALQDDWSVRVEALYASLSPFNYESFYIGGLHPYYDDNISGQTNVGIIRVGVNHSFGDADSESSSASGDAPDWTGPYAGIYLGGAMGQSSAVEALIDDFSSFYNMTGDTFAASTKGLVGGVEAGANGQAGSIVYGVEADAGYLGATGSQSSTISSETVVSSTGGPSASLRARLGVAAGNALFFGTAGVLVADLNSTVSDPDNDFDGDSGIVFTSHTGIQVGWIAGGGIEYKLNDGWSLKGEGLVYDLGVTRVAGVQQNPIPLDAVYNYGWDIHNIGAIVRVGLNKGF